MQPLILFGFYSYSLTAPAIVFFSIFKFISLSCHGYSMNSPTKLNEMVAVTMCDILDCKPETLLLLNGVLCLEKEADSCLRSIHVSVLLNGYCSLIVSLWPQIIRVALSPCRATPLWCRQWFAQKPRTGQKCREYVLWGCSSLKGTSILYPFLSEAQRRGARKIATVRGLEWLTRNSVSMWARTKDSHTQELTADVVACTKWLVTILAWSGKGTRRPTHDWTEELLTALGESVVLWIWTRVDWLCFMMALFTFTNGQQSQTSGL